MTLQNGTLAMVVTALFAGGVGFGVVGSADQSDGFEDPGYYCGNHDPTHYAANASELEEYEASYGCTDWTAVDESTAYGVVVNDAGEPLQSANVTLMANDRKVVAMSLTDNEGTFTLARVPTEGRYYLTASAIGYREFEAVVEASALIQEEAYVIRLGTGELTRHSY